MKSSLLVIAIVLLSWCRAEAQRTVLAEIFTNSHCGPCAAMHSAVKTHITNTDRDKQVEVVYYHMRVYLDDPIYQANTTEPAARAQVLGGVTGTPTTFFDGVRQTSNYQGWPVALDRLIDGDSPLKVTAEMAVVGDSVIVQYSVDRGDSPESLRLYGVVVEDITYLGRNGVSDRPGAMRALLTPVDGFTLSFDETGKASGRLSRPVRTGWTREKLRAVVSVQRQQSATSLAAVSADLAPTSVDVPEWNKAARVSVHSTSGATALPSFETSGTEQDIREYVASRVPSGAYFVQIVRGDEANLVPIFVVR